MTTREPSWTEQDRAEVLALALYRAWLCPCGCGHLSEDSLSDEATGPAFRATRIVCRARLTLIETQRGVDDGKPNPNAAARLWSVEKG